MAQHSETSYRQLLQNIAADLHDPAAIHARVTMTHALAPDPAIGSEPAEPEDACESAVLALWRDLLQAPGLSVDDGFMEHGGDSLTAMQTLARIDTLFGVEIPLEQLFQPLVTPRRLAALIQSVHEEGGSVEPAS